MPPCRRSDTAEDHSRQIIDTGRVRKLAVAGPFPIVRWQDEGKRRDVLKHHDQSRPRCIMKSVSVVKTSAGVDKRDRSTRSYHLALRAQPTEYLANLCVGQKHVTSIAGLLSDEF